MKSPVHPIAFVVAIAALCVLPAGASAQCAAPSNSGVVICQPSSNSTIYQVPHIEAAATPNSGSITSLKVFIDGKLSFQTGGPVVSLFPGGLANGTHHLVIKATDDFGRTYQAGEYFGVTGNLPQSCPMTTVGVRICAPAGGEAVGQNLAFALGFKGNLPIKHVRVYVENSAVADFAVASGQHQIIGQGAGTTAGTHKMTVVAWDTANHTYLASVKFKAYYVSGCPPKGDTCNPGIYPDTPNDGQDVASPFRVSASVENNTAAITAMKAYLNGHVAAISSGPTLDQKISAARGTYILVLQAWDSAGRLYRETMNVNVR